MKHKGSILEYSVGILIFLLIAILIVVGWRVGTGQMGEEEVGVDVSVTAVSPNNEPTSPNEQ